LAVSADLLFASAFFAREAATKAIGVIKAKPEGHT
jgi:hypothetical protein